MRARDVRRAGKGARALVVLLASAASASGCYRHHLRGGDAGPGVDARPRSDAGATRCGSERCALVDPFGARLEVRAPGLVGDVEGLATGLRGAPEVNGVAFELDACAWTGEAPCPTTVTVTNVGADLADPAVLAGAVEVSVRDRAIVVRADPCPGCGDGHVAAQLLFAAAAGELSPGFDLDLADVVLADAGLVCESRGALGESSGRYDLAFASTVSGASIVLAEGQTARLAATDLAVRLLRSSYECVGPDLPPPRPLEAAEWVIWIEGPR